jgi:putative heme-binding domain-containing protein
MKRCGVCHRLFGEGESIGPPLDAYQRGDVKFWLSGIVEPSLEIREGYQSYAAITQDGRVVTGMITAQDANVVMLRTADNRVESLPRDQLEMIKAIPTSLMPENLLSELSDDQIRDLFAYVSQGVQ